MLTLRLAALPHLDRFRPWVEQRAAHMLGARVSLGALSGRWHWRALRPEIEISDLNLRDAAGRPGLSIPQAIATLSWRTLWEFRPVFEAVHISAPAIVPRRRWPHLDRRHTAECPRTGRERIHRCAARSG